jgi:hypothetical protein
MMHFISKWVSVLQYLILWFGGQTEGKTSLPITINGFKTHLSVRFTDRVVVCKRRCVFDF